MNLILDDNNLHKSFAPLSLTRPVGNLRIGILTNDERWSHYLPEANISFKTEDYLSNQFKCIERNKDSITVNAGIIPNNDFVATVINLNENEALYFNDAKIAFKGNGTIKINYCGEEPVFLTKRWHIFQKNQEVIEQDFILLKGDRNSQELSKSNILIGNPEQLFIEEGASIEACTLNTNDGPIYIGENAIVMEGCLIRGAFALCEHATLKLGTKVYGPSSIGPYCKVGGEINNVVFQAYSNKGHDGFLGNSIIGEWCNLGADTNTSNLKNNYTDVKLWNYESDNFINTGLQFCGLMMGDHSKCGINTMFNTGTVVGVFTNIFGSGFPRNFVPSFSWGGNKGFTTYLTKKAFEVASLVMQRRGCKFTNQESEILKEVFEISKKYRTY